MLKKERNKLHRVTTSAWMNSRQTRHGELSDNHAELVRHRPGGKLLCYAPRPKGHGTLKSNRTRPRRARVACYVHVTSLLLPLFCLVLFILLRVQDQRALWGAAFSATTISLSRRGRIVSIIFPFLHALPLFWFWQYSGYSMVIPAQIRDLSVAVLINAYLMKSGSSGFVPRVIRLAKNRNWKPSAVGAATTISSYI
ncbi:uncharacterized protein ARMOST_14367 [Armillaria ostoyae]|uniref:Uncharacterized protein n=1 Tax=Armillaria ostoyae TaxID=47428 RepID=A0A284RQE4_ARMOS|nr:uncharacterized protein ARMOST_14367 [Armillaria ostoyae]